MSKDVIRIAFTGDYPYINWECPHPPHFRSGLTCLMPGFVPELLEIFANYLNLTIEITELDKYENRSLYFDELLEQNETDLVTDLYQSASSGNKDREVTNDFLKSLVKIAVRKTDHTMKGLFDFFSVYHWNVWIFMIVAFLLFALLNLLIYFTEFRLLLREKNNFGEILWKMLRLQLMQAEGMNFKLIAGKISLIFFSLFQIYMILGLFQGIILSSIVRKFDTTPFNGNDLLRLLRNKNYYLVVYNHSWFHDKIEENFDPFYAPIIEELRKALKHNPYVLAKTYEDMFQIVEEGMWFKFFKHGRAVALIDEGDIEYAGNHCNLIYLDTQFPLGGMKFEFKRGSRFVQMFNQAIQVNKYLMNRLFRKYWSSWLPKKYRPVPKPLSIIPHLGLLIIFFGGMLLGCFAFGGELMKFKLFSGTSIKKAITRKIVDNKEDILISLDESLAVNICEIAKLPLGTKFYALLPQVNNK